MAHLRRLSRPDHGHEADFVLLQIASEGRNPLDLKLIGTENTAAFSVSVKHKQTSKLKATNSTLTQPQWQDILHHVLLGPVRDGDPELAALVEGVEAVAKVEKDGDDAQSITIVIQKRIEGITQKLGTISLLPIPEDEDTPDMYDWCGLAIQAGDASKQELEALKLSVSSKDQQIKKLEQSLAELVKLKNENENQLLEKFSLLLNEKKLKIRDQQRLLASANVDPAKVAAVEKSRMVTRSRSPGPSREGKRKVATKSQASDDESDGFEKMEVDEPVDYESDEEPAHTPDHSAADETQSEDEDDDASPVLPPTRKTANQKQTETEASAAPEESFNVPPKRELPFAKKPPAQPPKPAPIDEGSETESDDEL